MVQQWQGKTDGNRWMQQQLINCFRFLNLRIYYAAVAFIAPFYMFFGRGFRPSYCFFRKRLHMSAGKSLWYSYKNHYRFGQVMIDRFGCYAGKRFQLETDGYELFTELSRKADSFIMLSAHVGCYEIGGYSLISTQKTINMLVFAEETETVMHHRAILFNRTNIRMIPVRPDMSHLFAINSALCNGEILSMTADRCNSSGKTITCPLFGANVSLPMGPFSTIAQRNVPALVVLVMKEKTKQYRLFIRKIETPANNLPRRQRIEIIARQYAAVVQSIVERYPEQWFNFFDLWQTTTSPNSKR